MKKNTQSDLEIQRAYFTKLKSIYKTKLLNIEKHIEEIDNELKKEV